MTDPFLQSATIQCPFPFYEELRDKEPVHPVSGHDAFLVARYEDCVGVLGDPVRFSSKTGPGLRTTPSAAAKEVMATGYKLVRTLLTNDPPDHRRYRSLVAPAFSARRVAELEPAIQVVVERLVGRCAATTEFDLVRDFAKPLPLVVIADFLGVSDGDLDIFEKWSDDAASVLGGNLTEEQEVQSTRSLVELLDYFAERTKERKDQPRNDFLTLLATNQKELSMEEIIALAYVVLVAGNETTVNLLSSMMLLLLENPDQLGLVRADRSLIPAAVEEALRLQAPLQAIPRVAVVDTEIDGIHVPAGSQVIAVLGSAHRDPEVFTDPDAFRLDRAGGRNHIAFGQGIHFCLGAALSRLEARLALSVLLDTFDTIELADPTFQATYNDNAILRSLQSLPVRVTTRRSPQQG